MSTLETSDTCLRRAENSPGYPKLKCQHDRKEGREDLKRQVLVMIQIQEIPLILTMQESLKVSS